jgi:uncharacterized protein (TIGR02301 family)
MGRGALIAILAAWSIFVPPALAQDRSPAQRQTLSELAFTLGQSHALRQACLGGADQYWRIRMSQLLQAEQSDQAFDRTLREAFNTGYAAAQGQYPACDARGQAEAARLARRGASLAEAAGRP